MHISLMYHVVLDHQVLIDKVGSIGIIGYNPPYFCCSQKYIFRLFFLKKRSNLSCIS